MFPGKEDPLIILIESMDEKSTSRAIENQEARGQQLLVNTEVLPRKVNHGTRQQFEKLGIVFGEFADDLFVYVALPELQSVAGKGA